MRFTGFEDMISYYADQTPDAPALRYEREGASGLLTYRELAAAVRERTEVLRQSGGKCLGVAADGSVECALTLLAAPAAGMRTVLFDAAIPEETLRAQTGRLGIDRMYAGAPVCLPEVEIQEANRPEMSAVEDAFASAADAAGEWNREGERKAADSTGEILFFTSGTTGAGRAVILTEQTLCASAYNGSAMLPLSPEDTLLCILPLNHVFGFVCGFLWGLSCGACVALGRGVRHYMDDCAYFKPTAISAVPMLFRFLLKHKLLNPECRLVLVGAGDCPAALLRTAKGQGIRVSFGYGLTETSSGVAISVEGDPYAMAVCPDNEIHIAEDGEILVKAPTCMMKGYAGEEEATREVLTDGILATGDLGYLDQDGKLHVTGRKKEMLVLADGTKMFLPEIEATLAALLGMEDIAVALSGEQPVLILGGEPASDKPAGDESGNEDPVNKTNLEDRIWKKIRAYQDAQPRGHQICAIRWYGRPLPRTATGKLKRWLLGNG